MKQIIVAFLKNVFHLHYDTKTHNKCQTYKWQVRTMQFRTDQRLRSIRNRLQICRKMCGTKQTVPYKSIIIIFQLTKTQIIQKSVILT